MSRCSPWRKAAGSNGELSGAHTKNLFLKDEDG